MTLSRESLLAAWVLAAAMLAGCTGTVGSGDGGADHGGPPDAGTDTGTDAGTDTGADVGADAHADAGVDAGPDAGPDAGSDGSADGGVARPAYNTGSGFFVLDGKLYDAEGVEFHIRGVNKCHYDFEWPGIPKARANTIRWSTPLWRESSLIAGLMQDTIEQRIVPMPAVWFTDGSYSDEGNVTCKSETGILDVAVEQWVNHAATFKPFERYLLVNIANEWGPEDSSTWRDAYIAAVARLRQAGYLATLVVDAGGCGQDPANLLKYAREVFDSDPQRNIVFDLHLYGAWANGDPEPWQNDLLPGLDRLAATGLAIIIGEFGPGRNIGPSPTLMTPGEIIQAADARGFGWLAWAWDDGDSDDWFALSYNGDYRSSADLTTFGKDVVETPSYGLLSRARPASCFP